MLRRSLLLPVATLVALALNVSGAVADPIPEGLTTAPAFAGSAAPIRPVGAAAVPRHPFMAPNGRSNLHDDAYQTDSYRRSGPLGERHPARLVAQLGGLSAGRSPSTPRDGSSPSASASTR